MPLGFHAICGGHGRLRCAMLTMLLVFRVEDRGLQAHLLKGIAPIAGCIDRVLDYIEARAVPACICASRVKEVHTPERRPAPPEVSALTLGTPDGKRVIRPMPTWRPAMWPGSSGSCPRPGGATPTFRAHLQNYDTVPWWPRCSLR